MLLSAERISINFGSRQLLENVNFYLNSVDPSKVSGGFEVNVPYKLASGQNIKTIQKWVDYYKPAGTAYTIKLV